MKILIFFTTDPHRAQLDTGILPLDKPVPPIKKEGFIFPFSAYACLVQSYLGGEALVESVTPFWILFRLHNVSKSNLARITSSMVEITGFLV